MILLPFTVNRHRESMDFIDLVKEGTPCIFFGNYGFGKTHILRNVIVPWLEKEDVPFIYLPRFNATKEVLLGILENITNCAPEGSDRRVSVSFLDTLKSSMSPRQIAGRIATDAAEIVPGKKFVLVIDDMDQMTKLDATILMDMYDSLYVCGAYSERRGGVGGGNLGLFLDMFAKVPVGELPKKDAMTFVDRLVVHFKIQVPDVDMLMFRNFILNQTSYFTLGVVDTLSRLRGRKITRESLHNISIHTGGKKQMSLAVKWVILFAILPIFSAMLWRAEGQLGLSYLVRGIGVVFIAIKLFMPK